MSTKDTARRGKRKRLLIRTIRYAVQAFLTTSERSAKDEAMAQAVTRALDAWGGD